MNTDLTQAFRHRLKTRNLFRTYTVQVDFEAIESEELIPSQIAIQMARPEDVNKDIIDWSKQYIWSFSMDELKLGDEIEFQNLRFKIVELHNASLYGYWKGICEEVKE